MKYDLRLKYYEFLARMEQAYSKRHSLYYNIYFGSVVELDLFLTPNSIHSILLCLCISIHIFQETYGAP